ncbi:hypothetical protein CYMTET_54586, partial [Cymbomonas tetramitiformis]
MAAAAGVPTSEAFILGITAGSVSVNSVVYFSPDLATSDGCLLLLLLTSDTASAFSTFGTTYGKLAPRASLSALLSESTHPSKSPSVPSPLRPPPPTLSLEGGLIAENAPYSMYFQQTPASTCLRIAPLNLQVDELRIGIAHGPSQLAWYHNRTTLCPTDAYCSVDICGFIVGTYQFNGTMTFLPSAGIPISNLNGTLIVYRDPNTTCITTENAGLVGGILTAQAQSISGSSTLSLTIDTADQCDARTSTCTIAFCGFRVGAWTLAGTLAADGFPVSTITGNVVVWDSPTQAPTSSPTLGPTLTPTVTTMSPAHHAPSSPSPLPPPSPPPAPPPPCPAPPPAPFVTPQGMSCPHLRRWSSSSFRACGARGRLRRAPDHPPQIYLLGEAYIEVDLKAVYVDAGAYAIDARESYVPVTVHGLDALSTDQPTEESFILRYTASDRKGNAARVVTRQVAVVDPCGWPASACPGNGSTVICETCVDSSASASGYSCLCISGDEGVDEDWEGEAATPSLDKVSPSLTLDTGEGTPVTLSGVRVIVHCLYVNAPWIEPGYSASDNVDGDVTAQVTKYGTHALWDTSVATPADDPFIIEYDVTDTAGNRAGVERRRVYVIDPCEAEGEVVCSFVTGECSVNQICVNSTQAVDATSSSPPELALVGPELITVNEGDYYGPCGLSYPAGAVCDHGATATDSLDGDLADHITACETETETNLFKVRGLSGCPLDTRTPGLYNITFAAANSAGLRAAAVRQLLVMINCVSYEHRCSSLLECSVNGLCQSDLGGGGESAQPAENSAPNLTVVEAGATPQYVDVKRFYEWALCGYNVTSTVEFPCDPGVEAYDAEDGNLT